MKYRDPGTPVAPEALPFALAIVACLIIAAIFRYPILTGGLVLMLAYVLWFFRSPSPAGPVAPGQFVSPASGTVVAAGIAPHPDFPGGQALRIAVFMSLIDVHMNYAPAGATVTDVRHVPGKFLNAMIDKAADENEHVVVCLRLADGSPALLKLVAGLVARRIVCPLEKGDVLEAREKIGLIRFGSRAELFLPATTHPLVAPGQKVEGGATPIAAAAA